jgi:acyl carrier protein
MTRFERLQKVLATHTDVTPDRLEPDAALADLGLDSLGMIEVMFDLEDEFGIRIPSDRVALATIGDLDACLERLIESGGGVGAPAVGGQKRVVI